MTNKRPLSDTASSAVEKVRDALHNEARARTAARVAVQMAEEAVAGLVEVLVDDLAGIPLLWEQHDRLRFGRAAVSDYADRLIHQRDGTTMAPGAVEVDGQTFTLLSKFSVATLLYAVTAANGQGPHSDAFAAVKTTSLQCGEEPEEPVLAWDQRVVPGSKYTTVPALFIATGECSSPATEPCDYCPNPLCTAFVVRAMFEPRGYTPTSPAYSE